MRPRAFTIACASLICQVLLAIPLHGDDVLPPQLDKSISRGLEFLASQQNLDGSFGATQKPAVTGLALMSFLASGNAPSAGKSEPNVGKYGLVVRGAIDYLLSQAQPDGTFGRNEKPMYGQGIVTLALAEAYGVDPSETDRKRIYLALTASIKVIVAAQDVHKPDIYAGGWRYEANAADSDLSLSGWSALSLRACQDVGVAVPGATVQNAVKFVLKCYNPESKGFGYQPGAATSPAMTGVGILCLHILNGNAPHPQADAAAKTLAQKPLDDSQPYAYYAAYYASQAAFQAGDPTWAVVWKAAFERTVKLQQTDGGWPDTAESAGTGRAYTTTMALLTLSIPYRLLPVYQR